MRLVQVNGRVDQMQGDLIQPLLLDDNPGLHRTREGSAPFSQ